MSGEVILAIATDVRAFLEPVWREWHMVRGGELPTIASENTCGRSSLFLQRALIDTGFAAEWVSGVSDRLNDPVGFFDGEIWRSHAWVQCEDLIVDITADQFGDRPVTVVGLHDDRYRKGPGDTALSEFVAARTEAVAAIWPRWIAARNCVIL
ncbi:MAG: lasso peptide biosynthesis protein [Brevundimonas sp.]|uniref:lasso peptide biosynthesis protein n=1 Tax=Brevundimonas sp. TaxID=1871086 RepID=UPI002735AD6B|nr:lasso peptide biosynthesis protein [Brevundimonas sp.]MDP3403854.1 lasso peptide biosynthesis protein [Brevundimonas sp.]